MCQGGFTPKEYTAAGGGEVAPIAARLCKRPSRPNARDGLILDTKEAVNTVARRRQEVRRHKAEAEDEEFY